MKSLFLVLGLIAAVHAIATAQAVHLISGIADIIRPGYIPTFFESFTGYPGTLPSSNNWIIDIGTSYPGGAKKWGNNEFQTYTSDTSNIHLTSRSTLTITPRLTAAGWTSARIETQRSDFVAKAGGKLYIEAEIQVGDAPQFYQQGIWPAFWALGSSFRGNYTNWPQASEWDFMEIVGGPTTYSTLHCGYAPGGPCNEYNGIGNKGVPFARGVWHTIGFEVDRSMCGSDGSGTWKDERLIWYLNGAETFNVTGATVADEEAWKKLAHEEHFLLLNLAVGGNWPGPPNNSTTDGPSVSMEIGYVGVWNSI